MNVKPSLLLLLLLSGTCTLSAQSVEKARKILDKVSATYSSYKALEGNFVYELSIPAEKFSDEQEGNFLIRIGDKPAFKLVTDGQEITSNGEKIWVYLPDLDEVQITDYSPDYLEMNPASMLTAYKSGYNYIYTGQEKIDAVNTDVVELTPIDKNKSHFKIRLFIDPSNNHIMRSKVFEKTGTTYTLTMTDVKPRKNLSPSAFSFNKSDHPGCTITDLSK